MEDQLLNAVGSSLLSGDEKRRVKKTMADLIEEYNNNLESFSLRELNLARLQVPYN